MTTPLEQLVAKTEAQFEGAFGISPRWIVAAPGRVNLIGEHIDYCDGIVMPMAIDRYTVIAAGEAPNERASLYSDLTADTARISLANPQRHSVRGHWSNYVAGVIAEGISVGMRPKGFQAIICSDVPLGSGLSSSAALEVAMATLLEAMVEKALDPIEKVLLCQKAEHEFAGVPCGIMDQFASSLSRSGSVMLLDCRSKDYELIPFSDPEITVLIVNTNVRHELTGGEYAERRMQCESAIRKLGVASPRDATLEHLEQFRHTLTPLAHRRAWHCISEIARTVDAAKALRARDFIAFGQLMTASHLSLRDDYEVSCHELDMLVELAKEIGSSAGVYGSRMTGAGFGGCTVSLVRTTQASGIAESLASAYYRVTGISPSMYLTRPSRGAHIIRQ